MLQEKESYDINYMPHEDPNRAKDECYEWRCQLNGEGFPLVKHLYR